MAKIKPATYVLEPGEYKDKLPPLHVVEVRCELEDRAPYEQMKKEFRALEITAINAGVLPDTAELLQRVIKVNALVQVTAGVRVSKADKILFGANYQNADLAVKI
jgi:hypothetical protein